MNIRKMVTAGVCLALCLLLPFLTGNNRELGTLFSLMHLPVLLCGFACGWQYGLIVGGIAPLLRFLLFGMPPMPVVAVPMAFELAVYGTCSGLLYQLLPKRNAYIYVSLVGAMITGRIINVLISAAFGQAVALASFYNIFASTFAGIILQIIIIPVIVMSLKRTGLLDQIRN